MDENTFMANVDIGEIFLNFILHQELQSLAGVDLTKSFPKDDKSTKVWETWEKE